MDEPQSDPARLHQRRHGHLARLLASAFRAVELEVRRGMAARGYAIDDVYLPVVRNVTLQGSRITEIADRAGLAKQTVGPLVRDLEERGILRVEPDPSDGRAKLVRFTELGLRGLDAGLDSVADIERRFAEVLDPQGVERLKSDLEALVRFLEPSPEEGT